MPAGFIDVGGFGQYERGFAASGDLRVEDDLRVVSVPLSEVDVGGHGVKPTYLDLTIVIILAAGIAL
jgi:hypothetical protein